MFSSAGDSMGTQGGVLAVNQRPIQVLVKPCGWELRCQIDF